MSELTAIEERRAVVNSHLEVEIAADRVKAAYDKAVAHWDLYTMAAVGPQLSVLQRLVRETKVVMA